ncbi:hypothetical protein [Branchiibius cervicis]|uniref:Phage holin family protein n=1 Tax=Branchiibius cervicis TaxID=908252 RepID=A0ABW2AUS5_9MICO
MNRPPQPAIGQTYPVADDVLAEEPAADRAAFGAAALTVSCLAAGVLDKAVSAAFFWAAAWSAAFLSATCWAAAALWAAVARSAWGTVRAREREAAVTSARSITGADTVVGLLTVVSAEAISPLVAARVTPAAVRVIPAAAATGTVTRLVRQIGGVWERWRPW